MSTNILAKNVITVSHSLSKFKSRLKNEVKSVQSKQSYFHISVLDTLRVAEICLFGLIEMELLCSD